MGGGRAERKEGSLDGGNSHTNYSPNPKYFGKLAELFIHGKIARSLIHSPSCTLLKTTNPLLFLSSSSDSPLLLSIKTSFSTPPTLQPHFSTVMSDSDSAQLKMVRVEIKGVVQGVCYRDWAVEHATELGLNGWVRNRKDGSVEAVFCGSCDKVNEMQQLCRRGPNAAMVTSLDSFPCNEDPGFGFQRRPTV